MAEKALTELDPARRSEDEAASSSPSTSEFRITDRASFETPGGNGRELAALYAFANLDVLVDLARLVSHDFFARPQLYIRLGDASLDTKLADLNARYGCEPEFPSAEQRQRIFGPLFGTGEAPNDFTRHRDEFLTDVAIYSQWTQATGLPMVGGSVRMTHHAFKEWLLGLSGASSNWSRWRALPRITEGTSYQILRDSGVAAVFTGAARPSERWPYVLDANGDKVVEEISRQLDPGRTPPLTRQRFSDLQLVALRGAEAIAAVLDFDSEDPDEDRLAALITRSYIWHRAMAQVRSTASGESSLTPSAASGQPSALVSLNGAPRALLPA